MLAAGVPAAKHEQALVRPTALILNRLYWFGGGGCGYTLLGLSVAVDGGMVLGYGDLRRLAGSDKQRSGFVR